MRARDLLSFTFLVFGLCIAGEALAGTVPEALLTVERSSDQSGLTVVLELDSSVGALNFDETYAFQRKRYWRFAGDGWDFDGSELRRSDASTFRTVQFDVIPDDRFLNRRYVALSRVGEAGWTAYTPALIPEHGSAELRIKNPGENSVALLGRVELSTTETVPIAPEQGVLLYIGPKAHVIDGSSMIIAGPEIPESLIELVQRRLTSVLDRMESLWGVAPPAKPVVYFSARDDDRGSGFKGGALADAAITLRTSGIRLDVNDQSLIDLMLPLVSHEAVHLWIGQRFSNSENDEQPWLHEGVTEYLSDRLWNSTDEIRDEFEERLNACAYRLDDKALRSLSGDAPGSVHYDCGYVINALIELAAIGADAGSIVDVWRRVTAGAESSFDVEKFLRVAAEFDAGAGLEAVDSILHETGQARWQRIYASMAALGIEAGAREPGVSEGAALREASLMPVLAEVCKPPYGYTTFDAHLELDTGDRCVEAIRGSPEIVAAGGHNLFTAPFEAYRYVQARCAERKNLELTSTMGEAIRLPPCSATISDLPPVAVLRAFPQLPSLAQRVGTPARRRLSHDAPDPG